MERLWETCHHLRGDEVLELLVERYPHPDPSKRKSWQDVQKVKAASRWKIVQQVSLELSVSYLSLR